MASGKTKQGVRDLGGNVRLPTPKRVLSMPPNPEQFLCSHPVRAQIETGCGYYLKCTDCGRSKSVYGYDYDW